MNVTPMVGDGFEVSKVAHRFASSIHRKHLLISICSEVVSPGNAYRYNKHEENDNSDCISVSVYSSSDDMMMKWYWETPIHLYEIRWSSP